MMRECHRKREARSQARKIRDLRGECRTPSAQGEEPQNKPTAGDADVVSTVRGGWGGGDFDNVKRRLRSAPEWEDVERRNGSQMV